MQASNSFSEDNKAALIINLKNKARVGVIALTELNSYTEFNFRDLLKSEHSNPENVKSSKQKQVKI